MKIKSSILLILLISLGLSIGIGVYQYLSVNALVKQRIFSEINFIAQSKAEVVETYMVGFEYEAQTLADVLAIKLGKNVPNMEEISELLRSVALRTPEMAHIDLFSPQGIVVASSDPSKIGGDNTQKDTYLEGKTALFFNNLHLPTGGTKPAFGVSMPIKDKNGELMGVVLVDVYSDKLYEILGEIYLVNKDNLLLSPSIIASDGFLKKEIKNEGVQSCATHEHSEHPIDSFDSLSVYTGLSEKRIVGSHVYLPKREWCLVAEVDEEEILTAPLRRLMTLSVGVGLLIFSLFALNTGLIYKIIIHPIQILHLAMENISKGKLEQKINIRSHNEIGSLARIFNVMADNVALTRTELEQKIRERTAELQKTKDGLEETVKERTAQLQKEVEEKTKMNEMMTGRELKMVELKKELELIKKEKI